METEEETVSQVVRQAERRGEEEVERFADRRGAEQGCFRWRGMETETKQRQDINQGNATAWQTANDTTRKQKNKKRETEISVRGAATLVATETRSLLELLTVFLLWKGGKKMKQKR